MWYDTSPIAITVCDVNGIIVYMNEKSKNTFEKDGGEKLIGSSLYECHTENSNSQIKRLIRENEKNTYTIEKKGIKKLIHQMPWYENENVAGLVEISIELPEQMQHHVRS